MTPPFNLEHPPTLDDINTLRKSIQNDNRAMDKYTHSRNVLARLMAASVVALVPICFIAMASQAPDSPSTIANNLNSMLLVLSQVLIIAFAFLFFSCGFILIFKKAPKSTCSHHYSVDDLTATSIELRAQNSNLIVNDNLTIQRYVKAVESQSRPLFKFELKYFSDLLTPQS